MNEPLGVPFEPPPDAMRRRLAGQIYRDAYEAETSVEGKSLFLTLKSSRRQRLACGYRLERPVRRRHWGFQHEAHCPGAAAKVRPCCPLDP